VYVGAALTDNDISGDNVLSAEFLYAKSLGIRIATVLSRAAALLVCHDSTLDRYVGDCNACVLLTVSVKLLIALTTLLLEHENLLALYVAIHGRGYRTRDEWCTQRDLAIVRCKEDVIELNAVASILCSQQWHLKRLLRRHRKLSSGYFYYCMHTDRGLCSRKGARNITLAADSAKWIAIWVVGQFE